MFLRLTLCLLLFTMFAEASRAQVREVGRDEILRDTAPKAAEAKALIDDTEASGVDASAKNPLYEKFSRLLTGAKLVGQFTIDGLPLSALKPETYEISKVEKAAEGDYWTITARIKYGEHDMEVPIMLEVKWAGSTPVITLDNLTIPGFGTFSSRVLFHRDRYVGTWQHGDKGGHMFGHVELADSSTDETKAE